MKRSLSSSIAKSSRRCGIGGRAAEQDEGNFVFRPHGAGPTLRRLALEAPPIQLDTSNALVCIVDGDPAVRDSLATVLDLSGLPVRTFATAGEFLDGLNGRPIRCVICEAELPDGSGLHLYQRFKQSHPDIRFALLMSRTDPAATAVARRCGIEAVFHKPLVHRRLTRFVTSA